MARMDALTQHRIATAYGNAMLCYGEACVAAWNDVATKAIDHMIDATRADAKPTSWFNSAPNGAPFYSTPNDPMSAWMSFAGLPVQTWLEMMPMRGTPAAWPFAYWMIAAGMPKDVAWPAAEGNAAVFEASSLAAEEINRAFFAAFPSDGGPNARAIKR